MLFLLREFADDVSPSPCGTSQEKLDLAFTIFFTVEMLLKIVALGFIVGGSRTYLRNSWNQLDAVVVLTSWIPYLLEGGGSGTKARPWQTISVTLKKNPLSVCTLDLYRCPHFSDISSTAANVFA
eukprot:SAG31_NODE_13773_length_847_cov_1.681818_1_plen_125_part_00